MLTAIAPGQSFAYSEPTKVGDLIAGGGNVAGAKDVGDVYMWDDGEYLYINYKIVNPSATELWFLTESHVEVKQYLTQIPQSKGNPVPGKFSYKSTHDYVTDYTYKIEKQWTGTVYVAVHGVVGRPGGLSGFEVALPSAVQASITYPSLGSPSYLPGTVVVNGGILDGVYNGWCINPSSYIYQGYTFNANVYSTYDPVPAGIVDMPENLDLINWIINQKFVGKASPGGYGTYTYGDVQVAIWMLIESDWYPMDSSGDRFLYETNPARISEIVVAAQTNGEGYIPGCGDSLAVIIKPANGWQIYIIEVPIPCLAYASETCWGGVKDYTDGVLTGFSNKFPGKNWALYLTYTF